MIQSNWAFHPTPAAVLRFCSRSAISTALVVGFCIWFSNTRLQPPYDQVSADDIVVFFLLLLVATAKIAFLMVNLYLAYTNRLFLVISDEWIEIPLGDRVHFNEIRCFGVENLIWFEYMKDGYKKPETFGVRPSNYRRPDDLQARLVAFLQRSLG